jgi:hypothetical protein
MHFLLLFILLILILNLVEDVMKMALFCSASISDHHILDR